MPNTLTPTDVYAIVNEIAQQATGRDDLIALDTSSFVAVGETLMRTGTENVLNAISTIIVRTLFDVRAYSGKLSIMDIPNQRWGAVVREITPLSDLAEKSEDCNTNLDPNQLADGNSIDHYKIKKPRAMQLNFCGTKKMQKHITIFRDQLAQAFTSEGEFASFYNAIMTGYANDLEILNEAKKRGVLLNAIAGVHNMGLTEVDVVKEYNSRNGTTLTRAQLLNKDNIENFAKFFASIIKTYSSRLTDPNEIYHANITGCSGLIRFTPIANQRMIMYAPLFNDIEANVYTSVFNPEYLNIGSFEGVNYWQGMDEPTKVSVKPNILDTTTGQSKNATATVTIPYVVGILYDEKFMGTVPQFDYVATTPLNAAGGYWNQYNHWRFNSFVNYTQQAVLFVLGEGGATA